jgi:hypothetical protein
MSGTGQSCDQACAALSRDISTTPPTLTTPAQATPTTSPTPATTTAPAITMPCHAESMALVNATNYLTINRRMSAYGRKSTMDCPSSPTKTSTSSMAPYINTQINQCFIPDGSIPSCEVYSPLISRLCCCSSFGCLV